MKRIKKGIKIFGYIILLCLVTLCITTFVQVDIMNKKYANIFGYTYFVVATGSMSGTAEVNDVIFVKITDKLKPGDVVTFLDSNRDVVTHRLIEIKGDKYYTKGDVNNSIDDGVSKRDIIGKVVSIISPKKTLEGVILLIVLFIVAALINFDKFFEKFIGVKSEEKTTVLPKDVFSSPKDRNDDNKTGLTVTISLDEVMHIKDIQDEDIEILEDEIDIIDVSKNDIVNKELNSISAKENELYELVSNLLRVKNNSISVSRIRKNWLNKFKYVYKIALLLQNNLDIVEEISNPTFTEVYDYDLERIGLYSNLRNRIYSAHIYVYLKILVFAILYNDTEYFDAVYKIMKYKILIDESKNFKVLSDQYSKKQIKNVINFMKNISDKYDNEDSFELDKIERLVKIKKI